MVLQGPEGQGPFVDESVTGEGRDRLAIPITQADLIERESKESKYPVRQKKKQP